MGQFSLQSIPIQPATPTIILPSPTPTVEQVPPKWAGGRPLWAFPANMLAWKEKFVPGLLTLIWQESPILGAKAQVVVSYR